MTNIKDYQTEEAIKLQKENETALRAARLRLHNLMQHEGFEDLFLLILDICNLEGMSYSSEATPTEMVYNEGAKSVGLILRDMFEELRPGFYGRLLQKRAEIAYNKKRKEKETGNG